MFWKKKKQPERLNFSLYQTKGDARINILAENETEAINFCKTNFPYTYLIPELQEKSVFIASKKLLR